MNAPKEWRIAPVGAVHLGLFFGDTMIAKGPRAASADALDKIAAVANTHADLVDMLQRALDTIDACGSINMEDARALVKKARKVAA